MNPGRRIGKLPIRWFSVLAPCSAWPGAAAAICLLFAGACGRPVAWTQPGAPPLAAAPSMSLWNGLSGIELANRTAARRSQQLEPDDPLSLRYMPRRIGPEVPVQAARLFEVQGKPDRAVGAYQEALAIDAGYEPALLGLARLYDRRGQFAEAEQWYRRAVELHPSSATARNDWAMCLARQGRLNEAIELWRQATSLAPSEVLYRNNLARALVQLGRYDEAFHELAAVLPPAAAHYNMGCLFIEAGQGAYARRAAENALAIDPAFTRAQKLLAKIDSLTRTPVAHRTLPGLQATVGADWRAGYAPTSASHVGAQPPTVQSPFTSGPARPNWAVSAPPDQFPVR